MSASILNASIGGLYLLQFDITAFNKQTNPRDVIKELLSAYETRDTVLIGDLAEYELAPRLRGLFAAMNEPFTEAA